LYKFLNIIRNKIFAFIYPLINNYVSEENKFLRNYVTDRTSGDILEIGAGNGGNINFYQNYNNLYLLDNNIDLLKKTTSVDKCTLILASSDYLPFKKSSFDSVVTSLVICSVNDVGKTFDELNRVLKSKGRYFFGNTQLLIIKLFIL
jgi:ubiquinone/menaquinone biosynthesis C-methylase UbiE